MSSTISPFRKLAKFCDRGNIYEKIYHSVNGCLILFYPEGKIADANEYAQKMFEYDYNELINLSWKDIVHNDFSHFFERFKEELLIGGHSQYEVVSLRKGGSAFPTDMQGTLFDHSGQSYLLILAREITREKELAKWNRYLMTHDRLTGLYNRAYFEEEIRRLERGRVFPVSIIMIDVDGLKAVNDNWGHSAGDELLRVVARLLNEVFRSEDVVARMGGDEFAILLPGANAVMAKEALSRVRSSLDGHGREEKEFKIALSLGSATGYQGCSLAKVTEEADKEMYQDKVWKRNRHAVVYGTSRVSAR